MGKIVMANDGSPTLLNYVLQRTANNYADWLIALWTNSSLSPYPTMSFSVLHEATFTGYARVTLDHTKWQAPTIVTMDRASSKYDTASIVWTNSGVTTDDIYGYAVITPVTFTLLWSQQLDAPISLPPGGSMALQPILDLGTLTFFP